MREPNFRLKSHQISCPCIIRCIVPAEGVPEGPHIYEGLATSREHSADGTTRTFHSSENATWHDGTAVTASDAIFSYRYLKEKGLKNRVALTAVHFDGMPRLFHDDIDRRDNFQTSPRGANNYRFDSAAFNDLIGDLKSAVGGGNINILSHVKPAIAEVNR